MAQIRAKFQTNGIDTAWLNLDSGDNDPYRFLSCLATAINGMDDEVSEDKKSSAVTMGFALGDTTLNIISQLAAHDAPFAIFLDDFEQIREWAVLGLVREIIERLPRRGQVVIGTRGLPEIGLGKLRARGQLVEIDSTRLRFNLTEATEFFTENRQIAISSEHIHQLHHKTEGWIAALWLASGGLEPIETRTNFIQRFSGSNQAVAQYLAEDVLSKQTQAIRHFLIRTSILGELNPSLCAALVPGINAATTLSQLDAANLFVIPIEGEQKSYRYHRLFADFLREQLVRTAPHELPRLHSAASKWYQTQQQPTPAIEHALDGGDFEQALDLLSQHKEAYLAHGRMRLLARWLKAIPEKLLSNYPMLSMIHVWSRCFTTGPWEAMELLERSGCLNNNDPDIQAHVLALRPLLLAMMDRYDEAYTEGVKNLASLPTTQPFADSVLSNAMAYVFAVVGHHRDSQNILETARRNQQFDDGSFNKMYTESVEGVIDLIEGRFRQASARFRMAVSSATPAPKNYTNGNAWAGVLYASSVYEVNNLEQAEHLLNIYVPLAKDVVMPDHIIIGYIMLSRSAFVRGDIDHGFQLLSELEQLGHRRQIPRITTSAKLERARVLLLQNHAQAAKQELERANGNLLCERLQQMRLYSHDIEYPALADLRWEIHFGDSKKALSQLGVEISAANQAGRQRRVLKLRILETLALQKNGDRRAALSALTEVLNITCAEGYIRLILDEGALMGILVRQFQASNVITVPELKNPIFAEYLQRLVDAFGPPPINESVAAPSKTRHQLIEALTQKEVRVLLLLAEGYSNNAMAEKLFISDSTVRTHLRNINAKLNAQSRTQAVAIARHLGLIQ